MTNRNQCHTLHTDIVMHSHTPSAAQKEKDLSNFMSDVCIACTSNDQIFNWKLKWHIENRAKSTKTKTTKIVAIIPYARCLSVIVWKYKRHEIMKCVKRMFQCSFAANLREREREREIKPYLPAPFAFVLHSIELVNSIPTNTE